MPNQCARKCCHCGQKGHNSRTCTSKGCGVGFKLFGVQIDVPAGDDGGGGGGGAAAAAASSTIRKSKSLGNLEACNPESGGGAAASEDSGYLSDGLIHQSSKSLDRKKGKPWSEEEHRSFLLGLEKLGKGDWKGIASKYVPSRKSSQVASHAQKYFIRKAGIEKRRRRTSVFDIPLTDSNQSSSQVIPGSQQPDKAAVESSQPAAAVVASSSSKNMAEPNGQATNKQPLPAHVATSERPPLSPMKTHGFVDFRGTFYKPYWVPVVNFPSQNSSGVFIPNMHGALAACTAFVPQQHSAAAWRQPLGQQSFSQAGSAAPIPNNDELNLNIRKLALQ
ncbi:hypothetical protein ACP275_06G053200 [Erythranthe tilingii]